MRVLFTFFFHASARQSKCSPIPFLVFAHLGRWHPGKSKETHMGEDKQITYQNALRKGLRVEALLRLLALVVLVVVAGRHGFLRRKCC